MPTFPVCYFLSFVSTLSEQGCDACITYRGQHRVSRKKPCGRVVKSCAPCPRPRPSRVIVSIVCCCLVLLTRAPSFPPTLPWLKHQTMSCIPCGSAVAAATAVVVRKMERRTRTYASRVVGARRSPRFFVRSFTTG